MKRVEILDVEEADGDIIVDLEYETDAADESLDIICISLDDILDAMGRKRAAGAMLKLLWLLSIATRRMK